RGDVDSLLLQPVLYDQRRLTIACPWRRRLSHRFVGTWPSCGQDAPRRRARAQAGKRDPRSLRVFATNFLGTVAGRELRSHAAAVGNGGGSEGAVVRFARDAGGEIRATWRC